MFTYDGKSYGIHVISLSRSFAKLSTDQSGRVQSGEMFIDLIGTYYNYTITVEAEDGDMEELDRFWEDISAPKAFVTVVFPYNQSTLTYSAYVTQGNQNFICRHFSKRLKLFRNLWGPITLNFVSKGPQRRPLL